MVVGGVLLALLPLLAFKHKCCGKFYPLAVYSNLHSAATVLCQCKGAVVIAGEGSGQVFATIVVCDVKFCCFLAGNSRVRDKPFARVTFGPKVAWHLSEDRLCCRGDIVVVKVDV